MPTPTIQATFDLAFQHHQAGRLRDAEPLYQQILAQQPEHARALHYLGVITAQTGRTDLAVTLLRRAVAGEPDWPKAHYNLGNALREQGQLDEAIKEYRQALALQPDFSEALINLGNALKGKGQLDQAIATYNQAIALNANSSEAHYSLSLALLAHGDFAQGWAEHEWRWQSSYWRSFRRNFTQPQWDGAPLHGRRILLHGEQGLGDTLHFIRYLPLVIQRGGRVIVECQPALQRLIQANATAIPVVAKGRPLPDFDVHCPLLSLPRMLRTTLADIPAKVPYLRADAQAAAMWQTRLASRPAALKAGLVWAGNPQHTNDRSRSMRLAMFAPLAQVPGVQFHSLQKGEASTAAKSPPPGLNLLDATDDLKDFADTAALIANLDLVIAVDTSVVHLAGAMGKPVWTLLPFCPDWRWLLDRQDSPWYPTMLLFRQPAFGDWASVMQQVAGALAGLV